MPKSVKIAIISIITLLILSSMTIIVGSLKNNNHAVTAEIYQNGSLIHTINLSEVTESYEIVVENGNARNVILVEPGRISMADATCPDHICVKTGKINSPFTPITCLPNKVLIQIRPAGDSLSNDNPDGIAR